MKILFLSDIHGVPAALEAALAAADPLGYDRIALLGDLLYHGPRNGIPEKYDPVATAAVLNSLKDKITAVRGNCDAEVDQMMLEFPIMADSTLISSGNTEFFLTHGHIYNENRQPRRCDVLAHGHTHIAVLKELESGITLFNPGSVSLPKGGTPRSFGWYNGSDLSIHTF